MMNSISARWTPAERELQYQHILSWIGNDAIAAAIRDSLGIYQDIDHTIDLLSSNEDLINALKNQKGSFNIKNEEEFEIIKKRMTAIPAFIHHIDCQHPHASVLLMGKHHASYLQHSMEDFDTFINNIHLEEYTSIREELRMPDWCAGDDRWKDALWDTLFDDVCRQQSMDISHSDELIPSIIESDGESSNSGQISVDMVDGEKDSITLVLLDSGIERIDDDISTSEGGDSVASDGSDLPSFGSGEYADDELGGSSLHPSIPTDDIYGTDTNSTSRVIDAFGNSAPMLVGTLVQNGTDTKLSGSDGDKSNDFVPVSNVDANISTINNSEAVTSVAIVTSNKIASVEHTAAEDIMHRTGDIEIVFLYKMSRMLDKRIRCNLSRHLMGTSRNYQGASLIANPFAITIQKHAR